MRDEDQQPEDQSPAVEQVEGTDILKGRRDMLRISALVGAAVVTVRPGMAQGAVASALTCKISIPLSADSGKWVKKDGSTVKAPPPTVANSWAFPSQPLAGEDVKNAIKYDTSIPGTSAGQTDAYVNYINAKITSGKPGFTCYASLQSPNRY